jgi:phosphate transport system substrate-binding protein
VVELRVGQGAVVIAMRRGDNLPNLSTYQIYTALAADLAQNEEFIDNTLNTWSRVGANLPETPIRAILPDRTNGTRALFNDFVMEGGCRDVKAVRLIFLASIRVPKCTTLRHDGRVRETSVAEVPAALLDSPPGTIAAISYAQLLESGGNLVPVALNGVLPSATSTCSPGSLHPSADVSAMARTKFSYSPPACRLSMACPTLTSASLPITALLLKPPV